MRIQNKIYDTLFCLLAGSLYAYALGRTILSSTVLEADPAIFLKATLLLMAAWCLILFNRWTALIFFGGGTIAAAITSLFLWRQSYEAPWFLELSELVQRLWDFLLNPDYYQDEFSLILSLLLALIVTLITVLNLQSCFEFGFYLLTLLALGAAAVPLYMEWGSDPTALWMMALSFVILLVKKLNLFAAIGQPNGERYSGAFALAALPLCGLVFAAGWFAPKPDVEAIRERGLPDISWATDNLLYSLMPDQVYSWSDEGGRLGGPRVLNDMFVMEVAASEGLYLAGNIMDSYTGSSWRKTLDGPSSLDAAEPGIYPIDLYSDPLRQQQQYYMRYYDWKISEVTIITGEARTKTVYTPPYPQTLRLKDQKLRQDGYGILTADKPLPREFSYTQSYISWKYDSPWYDYIMREALPGSNVPGLSLEELEPYLALPDTLPDRVRELSQRFSSSNPYLVMTWIESYLRVNFPYTLEPSHTPAGADFVDYFLFEEEQGYCVYFATAMAVLGRCQGVPTRYVEGFVLPAHRNVNGNYTVTNQQAHAWVEAWIPGMGWVRFEPTPPLSGQPELEFDPEPLPDEEESIPEEEISLPEEESKPEPEEESQPEESVPPPPKDMDQEPSQPDQPTDPSQRKSPVKAIALILCLAALAAGFAILWAKNRSAKRQQELEALDDLPHREAVIGWFGGILQEASRMGYPMKSGETVLTYARRTEDDLQLEELAAVFCLASYSSQDISQAHREAMKARYYALRHQNEENASSSLWSRIQKRLGR